MARPQIQARVEPAREKEVEEFAEEHDMSKAGAVRHLVERGLDYEEGRLRSSNEDTSPTAVEMLASTRTMIFGLVFFAISALSVVALQYAFQGGLVGVAIAAGAISVTSMVVAILTIGAAALAQLSLGRPLKDLLRRDVRRGA